MRLHRNRPSAHEAVQNGKISAAFRYFALLHWANGSYTPVKMTSNVVLSLARRIFQPVGSTFGDFCSALLLRITYSRSYVIKFQHLKQALKENTAVLHSFVGTGPSTLKNRNIRFRAVELHPAEQLFIRYSYLLVA